MELHLLQGRAHDLRPWNDDDLTLPFLARHRRDPFPRRLELTFDARPPQRIHWVEVFDKARGAGKIETEVLPGNRLEVVSHRVRQLRLHLSPRLFPEAGPVQVRVNGREVFSGPLTVECGSAEGTLPVDVIVEGDPSP